MTAGVLKGERLERELARLGAMTQYEKEYEAYAYVCGIDEAGKGPPVDPTVAGVVILPKGCQILYLNDSKKLSEERGEKLFEEIKEKTATWSMEIVSSARINEINILQAIYEVMRDVVGRLGAVPDMLLNDAVIISGLPMKQVPIIKGDAGSFSIAAVGAPAKVTRDHMMVECGEMFPGYGFVKRKGYGTAAHIQAIRELRSCPIHRRSFIRDFVKQGDE